MASTATRKRSKSKAAKAEEKIISLVSGDFLVTFVWVAVSCLFSEVAQWLSNSLGMSPVAWETIVVILAVIAVGPLCNTFGGSVFNPVHNAAFIICGKGTWTSNCLRMAGQLAGALLGTMAAVTVIPASLQGVFPMLPGGLKDGVAVEIGFLCECVLSAIMNLCVLYTEGLQNSTLSYWILIANITLNTLVGMHFTGPSLNPFISFSWYWHYQGQPVGEHFTVYWAAPFSGAVVAGLLWRRYTRTAAGRRALAAATAVNAKKSQ